MPCFFDTITKELAITNLAKYISLKENPIKWARKIEKAKYKKKNYFLNEIRKKDMILILK